MFGKVLSSALLCLVLAQGAIANPKPIVGGGPNEPPPCVPACTITNPRCAA
ncbi:hypothetical protein K438DRAFT_1966770 [Mycena galopus ATCC 62051]|nr:hypothetical protein K438DRAFT_1966770 [Mycena galopus ATCC 62051]